MLRHISIKNFAIIEHLDLELDAGLTVLTGETGAGKSILIDALNLTLGGRASAEVVRHGASKSDITASFDITQQSHVKRWLSEHDYDAEEDVMLRRVINQDGRSRAYINGNPTQLQQLKTLSEMLIDIHGQHEHQSLIKADKQRTLLDRHGQHDTQSIANTYQQWRQTEDQYLALQTAASQRDTELDLLRFQTEELEQLALQLGEAETLEAEHQRLANAGDTITTSQQILDWLYEADEQGARSAHTMLSDSQRLLDNINDPALDEMRSSLSDVIALTQDVANDLRHYVDKLDIDPARLDEVEQRLGLMHDLARKHQIDADALPSKLTELQTRLTQLDNAEFELEQLAQQRIQLAQAYTDHATTLHTQRVDTAKQLSDAISNVMQTLGMPQGRFVINVEHQADIKTKHGSDTITFLVAANPGQPAKPLSKVASGGELARISLAIQVIAAAASDIPSMIFDEVDTGVGGGVAEMVGKTLRELGERCQALCVTHLPQVAAQGHHHLQVSKTVSAEQTTTSLEPLTNEQRVAEIARMLGGVDITEQTLAHAQEMLGR